MHFDWQEHSSCLSRPCLRSCPLPRLLALFAARPVPLSLVSSWFTVWQVQLALAQLGCEWVTFHVSNSSTKHSARARGHGTWGLGHRAATVSFPGRSWVSCAEPRRYRHCSLTPWAPTVLPNTWAPWRVCLLCPVIFSYICVVSCVTPTEAWQGVREAPVLMTRLSSALPRVKARRVSVSLGLLLDHNLPMQTRLLFCGFKAALCLPFSLHQHRSLCPLESISTVCLLTELCSGVMRCPPMVFISAEDYIDRVFMHASHSHVPAQIS